MLELKVIASRTSKMRHSHLSDDDNDHIRLSMRISCIAQLMASSKPHQGLVCFRTAYDKTRRGRSIRSISSTPHAQWVGNGRYISARVIRWDWTVRALRNYVSAQSLLSPILNMVLTWADTSKIRVHPFHLLSTLWFTKQKFPPCRCLCYLLPQRPTQRSLA